MFQKLNLIPSSGEERETPTLLGLRTMDKVPTPSASECYISSSEPFRIYPSGIDFSWVKETLNFSFRQRKKLLH
jgi:hypothetical protein